MRHPQLHSTTSGLARIESVAVVAVALLLLVGGGRWPGEANAEEKSQPRGAKATKPAATKPSPAKPATAKPSPAKPAPNNAATAGKQPAATSTTSAKKPAAPPASPLAAFPSSVALPVLDKESASSLQPAVLAPVSAGPSAICILHLMNESAALPGGKSFGLEAVATDDVEREWNVVVRGPGMETGGVQIARLELRDQQMRFTWLAAALDEPLAPRLANVALKIALGTDTKTAALRRPTRIPLIALSGAETLTPRWELGNAPLTSSLRVELRLASREPRYRFVGPAILSQQEPTTWIEFGLRAKDDQGMKLKITADFRQGVGLKIEPYFQPHAQAKVMPLTEANLRRATAESEQAVAQLKLQLAQLGAATGGGKGKRDKGKGGKPTAASSPAALLRRQVEDRLRLAESARGQVAEVRSLMNAIDGKSKLHVRVYHEIESYPFDLLTPKP